MSKTTLAFLILSLGAIGAKCNGTDYHEFDTADTNCKTGAAVITVSDGFWKNACGCAESTGQLIHGPTALVCTINAGTTVFFYYSGPFLQHQIVPVGTPSFNSSLIFDPSEHIPNRTHAVTFGTTGTYNLKDNFDPTLTGQIIVN